MQSEAKTVAEHRAVRARQTLLWKRFDAGLNSIVATFRFIRRRVHERA
jgi:hypothetical protein